MMDIEHLTKMQIVLLTLLVSFITSIATGIVTVTLLAQAPPAVTQTINRVVERTVERVVPGEPQSATVIEKEVTVVVKEDDIITDSISRNSKSLARISKKITFEDGTEGTAFVGLGIVVSKQGVIATDSSIISSNFLYSVTDAGGTVFDVKIADAPQGSPIILLSAVVAEKDEGYKFLPAMLSAAGSPLKLGQTVISLGGKNRTDVSLGIVSSIVEKEVVVDLPSEGDAKKENTATTTKTVLSSINTDIAENSVQYGSPLVDIFGEVIGINTKSAGEAAGTASYTPSHFIASQMTTLTESAKNEAPAADKKNPSI